jgi:hypothetical protein
MTDARGVLSKYRQCTCNVTYSALAYSLLLPKNNNHYIFFLALHFLSVCSLSYLACKAHATYYIAICGVSCSAVFFHFIS